MNVLAIAVKNVPTGATDTKVGIDAFKLKCAYRDWLSWNNKVFEYTDPPIW